MTKRKDPLLREINVKADPAGRLFACTRCGDWTGDPAGHLRTVHDVDVLATGDFTLVRGTLRKTTGPRVSRKAPPQEEVLPW